ncbi:MAG: nucleotide exchange factor GrpE [Planctomycetes bacterium]|nr:nucleotide exchange factor GrpE [Planctomycetota bacterium]
MMKKVQTNQVKKTDDAHETRVEAADDGFAEGQEGALPTATVKDAAESTAPAKQPVEQEDTVESLREKIAALEDTLLRAKADFVNTQRRNEKSRLDAVQFANAELMRSLLGVLDDFERSLDAAGTAEDIKTIVEGVRLVYQNLEKALRDHGLESIEAIGRPFDPHVHEAVMQQPAADCDPNTVLEEVAKGYRLKDRVIRPAKVVVSKALESTSGATEKPQGDQASGAKPSVDENA